MAKSKLEEWINVPSVMETKHGKIDGMVKYGIRLPIRSATTPLRECEIGSEEQVDGEKAKYWFVNDEEAIKIRMIAQIVKEDVIKGMAYSNGFFTYTIRRK